MLSFQPFADDEFTKNRIAFNIWFFLFPLIPIFQREKESFEIA